MRMLLLKVGLAVCAAVPALTLTAQSSTLLRDMQDNSRPLLIFAGPTDPQVGQQYRLLAANAAGVQDRQVRIVLVTTAPTPAQPLPPAGTVSPTLQQQAALRTQFHVAQNSFAVVLIGKDGGEKFRSSTPISFATLTHIIDAMPMRQQEERAH